MEETILRMKNIHKKFPGVYALKDVHFELKTGEVHALLGENGAGKSTLMKILGGIYQTDEGEIWIKGNRCELTDVKASQSKGISIIHQELCLVPYMTVAENIFLGRELLSKRTRLVTFREMNIQAQQILDSIGLDIRASEVVSNLSVAQQQMVEIAKALSVDADIIVMDEPTASLTEKEVEVLFQTIQNLKEKNKSIIYISHRMEELFKIADRITILRDGTYIDTKKTTETSRNELISMMVGRELKDLYRKEDHQSGDVILQVHNICKGSMLKNISFSLRKGEILGLSGIVGAGRTELARVIFGIDRFEAGEIFIDGNKVSIQSSEDAIKNGIALVPESRKDEGLFLIRSVAYNTSITVLEKFMRYMKVDAEKEHNIVQKYIESLSIKTPDHEQCVENLSGGNQQKIVIAKWLATQPRVLILDEPTRGVDVGAKAEIYSIISMLAKQGVAIIMISSELPEVINMSDRVLVMHEGKIMAELEREQISQETIMHYATGGMENAV
ncbi:MAG: sugar ABC transporter ATP-binding protein [Bacillota bacterium]